MIILTGSYRKTFYGVEHERSSGTGGFLLWAETTIPVPYNLNTLEGKNNLITDQDSDLNRVQFVQLHSLDGDDASCLNLNQVTHPGILGIDPQEFYKRDAFSFISVLDLRFKKHPWLILGDSGSGNVIPALADQTVIQYGLNKAVGDTIQYMGESGEILHLRLVASLDNSIFQGKILIADSAFIKHFPSAGSNVTLIDAPESKLTTTTKILNTSLSDHGVVVTPAGKRLAAFNSVENTYLSVFMVLGGLGLLLGTFGLGIILFRNMIERRYELALLRSVGYRKNQVFQLVLVENMFLLVTGMLCGLISALIAILPSMLSPAFHIQGTFLSLLITIVLILGLCWIYVIAKSAVHGNLIENLRDE
jgi:hypothetical protein